MTAIPSRQRKMLVGALLSGLTAAALLPIGVVFGARALLNSSSGSNVGEDGALKIPSTPASMLATVNDVGHVTSLTTFVLDPSGVGGTIISLPVGSRAEQAGEGPARRIGDSFVLAGPEALTLEVEGLLDVSLSFAEALDARQLGDAFAGLPDTEVTFDVPLVNTSLEMPDPASTTTVRGSATTVEPQPIARDNEVYPAGARTLAASEFPIVLLAQRLNEPESARLPRIKSLWDGIARSTLAAQQGEAEDQISATAGEPTNLVDFMKRVFAGRIQVWQMSHRLIEGEANPTRSDVYALDPFEVRMIMASVAPSSLSLPADAVPVQLDSPFNDATVTRAAVERLASVGLSVALIRETAETAEKNTVFYYSDQVIVDLAERQLETVIGTVNFQQIGRSVEGIGAHVVIGESFRDFVNANPVIPTTTVAEGGQ
ncbi:MAG: hypothetical protein ACKOFZ_02160 [Ilumatobacteraceae bacterium]